MMKKILLTVYGHLIVTSICINVAFDLAIGIFLKLALPSDLFLKATSYLIDFTTPIVYGLPLAYSKVFLAKSDVDLLVEAKAKDSLLLANHGSRIDWMIAMFAGHLKKLSTREVNRCRVGFVCEALLQFMPLIGWYRNIVCKDIFVWRSFGRDESTIKKNISEFKTLEVQRMLFLSPEGVIVDHGEQDKRYIQECREFSLQNGMKPFEYVLTPRYKGTNCLLAQGKTVISVCLVYIRNNKLLNCKLLAEDERVVPDIYDLTQGIGGEAVDVYVHLRKIEVSDDSFDAKTVLFREYAWKDEVLKSWEEKLAKPSVFVDQNDNFTQLRINKIEILLSQIAHVLFIGGVALYFERVGLLMKAIGLTFLLVSFTHSFGCVFESSKESVPFETGIKAMLAFIQRFSFKIRTSKTA